MCRPADNFLARWHAHYYETVLPVDDGLPKMHDVPREMGGSGETLSS